MENLLPLTMIEDSSLFNALKSGKLKGPNAVAFDASAWVDFAAAILKPTVRDADLLQAAVHFGLEFESLRSRIDDKLPRLPPTDAVDFVVAGLNIQTITVISRTRAKLRKQARTSDAAYLGETGAIRVQNSGGQSLNPDDAMANFVDGMANLLFRVTHVERKASASDRTIALQSAQNISMFVSIEQGLKELWGRAAWEAYAIERRDNHTIFAARDAVLARQWLAWQRRFETIILQRARLETGEALVLDVQKNRTPILERTVVGLEDRSGQKKKYIIGKARNRGNEQTLALDAIKATYLTSFLDEILPRQRQTGLTYRDIWRAWWVLQDIAEVHEARVPSRGARSWDQIGSCALRFSISRAVGAIAEALNISQSAATVVMEIFTADPDMADRKNATDLFQHGAWGRPILRSFGEDRGRILLAALMSPNPVMMMESWLSRTGLADHAKSAQKTNRGRIFERVARERLRTSGTNNSQLSEFSVSHLSSRGESSEEIDALVRIGNTIIVCEVKCFSVPFSSIDRYNHLRKIQDAAEQAARKAEWLRENPASIFEALSIYNDHRDRKWTFLPIVVLNSAYGAGLTIDKCAITDLDWLSTFVGTSQVAVGGTFERGRGAAIQSQAVYRNQADLEERLAEIAVAPPSLAFELRRIEWEMIPFPTRLGEPMLLHNPVSKWRQGASI